MQGDPLNHNGGVRSADDELDRFLPMEQPGLIRGKVQLILSGIDVVLGRLRPYLNHQLACWKNLTTRARSKSKCKPPSREQDAGETAARPALPRARAHERRVRFRQLSAIDSKIWLEDILETWKSERRVNVSPFRAALKLGNRLAHGRHWHPKLGQGPQLGEVRSLAADLLMEIRL